MTDNVFNAVCVYSKISLFVFCLSSAGNKQGLTAQGSDLSLRWDVDSFRLSFCVCVNIIQCVISPSWNINMLLNYTLPCRPSGANCPINIMKLITKYYLLCSSKCQPTQPTVIFAHHSTLHCFFVWAYKLIKKKNTTNISFISSQNISSQKIHNQF